MPHEKINILLADDDSDDCHFFKQALNQLPLSTNLTIVNDGEELMNYLSVNSTNIPHVLFLDINMPRKNGLECLVEIKENKKLKDLSIVMFSTTNSWETIDKLFKGGVNVYIHKPNDLEQLKQVINHALPIASEKTTSKNSLKYILNAGNRR